jgi:hypothetical protein
LLEIRHETESTSGPALAKRAVTYDGTHRSVTYCVADSAAQTATFMDVGHIQFLLGVFMGANVRVLPRRMRSAAS